jgi:hypothetical protein
MYFIEEWNQYRSENFAEEGTSSPAIAGDSGGYGEGFVILVVSNSNGGTPDSFYVRDVTLKDGGSSYSESSDFHFGNGDNDQIIVIWAWSSKPQQNFVEMVYRVEKDGTIVGSGQEELSGINSYLDDYWAGGGTSGYCADAWHLWQLLKTYNWPDPNTTD